MKEFFAGQMDYIYFLYGFGFLILAISCYFLNRSKSSKLPWNLLFFFAFLHGMNEWADLLAFSLGDTPAFNFIRIIILGASYIFLFEFGRISLKEQKKINIDAKIYLLIILLIIPGIYAGSNGFNAAVRYFIGFPGGLLSAYAVFSYLKKENIKFPYPLYYFGIAMVAYGFLSGGIVPKIDLFPGNYINIDSFFAFFYFPIQAIRGIVALLMAYFSWDYFSLVDKESAIPPRYQMPKMVAIVLTLIIGWGFIYYLGNITHMNLHKINKSQTELVSIHLSDDLENIDNMAKTLSGSPYIPLALLSKNRSDLDKTNSVLDRYNIGMKASVCYVIDPTGIAIASSNRNGKESFVGNSYKFRQYFINAINGKPFQDFGVGVTSSVRGYYSSYPIKTKNGKIIGVVVAKEDAGKWEKFFKGTDYSFLIDSNGIIFLSNDPKYLFHSLGTIDEKIINEMVASKRFSDQKILAPITSYKPKQNDFINFEGSRYHIFVIPLGKDGWSLIFFASAKEIGEYRLIGIIIIMILASTLTIAFITLNQAELREIYQVEKLKDDLTHMMVHDLKNPLTSMISATELIGEPSIGTLNEEQEEIVGMLKIGEKKLLNLSMNILDLKKFEENKYQLDKSTFNATDLAKEITWTGVIANQEGKNFMFNIEKGLNITADKNILIRIIENLLSNAMKHTKQGANILLNIKKENNMILFEVIDTGEGIEKAALPYLFNYFAIVKNQKLKTRFDTGLGLAFCKLAVEAHNGTIGVQSEAGEGSRFYFYLPAN